MAAQDGTRQRPGTTAASLTLDGALLHPLVIGGIVGILELLAGPGGSPLLIAPFAASAMLAIAAPTLPASRPLAVIGGNVLAATAGVTAASLLGQGLPAMATAVILSAALMQLTRPTPDPAAATEIPLDKFRRLDNFLD